MNIIALLGDSIFDNEVYVPRGHTVLDCLRRRLGSGARADLLAVDGCVTYGISHQLKRLGLEHTHLVISTGGNDALACRGLISGQLDSLAVGGLLPIDEDPLLDAGPDLGHVSIFRSRMESLRAADTQLAQLAQIRALFRGVYRTMLETAVRCGRPVVVCTVYDSVPGLDEDLKVALAVFNEVILFEASECGVPVIDLRSICDDPGDFSDVLMIEPSAQASGKIAEVISYVVTHHDFAAGVSSVYGKRVLR